jgi:hypothetical protein
MICTHEIVFGWSNREKEAGEQYDTFEREKCVQGLLGRPEGKKPLGRPSLRWEDSIKIDLQEVGWGGAWNELICVGMGPGGGLL